MFMYVSAKNKAIKGHDVVMAQWNGGYRPSDADGGHV